MNHCKICGRYLLDSHYAMHNLTKEEYEEKYGTDEYNSFRSFKIPPKREVSECEKRDALHKLDIMQT